VLIATRHCTSTLAVELRVPHGRLVAFAVLHAVILHGGKLPSIYIPFSGEGRREVVASVDLREEGMERRGKQGTTERAQIVARKNVSCGK
jgi:hypothetical protein